MGLSVKQNVVTWITGVWCVCLVLLLLGQGVDAAENIARGTNGQPGNKTDSCANKGNDPNERWWRRWDVLVGDSNDPNELLRAKWGAVINVLQNKELDQESKKNIIDKVMSPVFDFELMAKLSLGKTNWPKLTEPQQKQFTELFTERVKSFYLEKTTLYKNEMVLFKPATQKKNAIHIPMVLVSSEKEVAILYKLHKFGKCWKIYDVEVQGVSVLLTYRSQFDDILRRGTVDDLLSELQKPPAQ